MKSFRVDPDEWILKASYPFLSLQKWQKTVDLMAEVYNAPSGFIVQYTKEGYQVVIANQSIRNPYSPGGTIPSDTNIFCRKVVTENKSLYVKQATQEPQWNDNPEVVDDGFNSYLGVPIVWPDGTPFGTICVMDFTITHYKEAFIGLMREFGDIIERDLLMLQQYYHLQEISLRDELTDIYNRRGFITLAPEKINLVRRYAGLFAMMFIDIDEFKRVNDEFGHAVGDSVLKQVAEGIRRNLRDSDLAARFGGDEFVAIVFVDAAEEVNIIIQRLKSSLQAIESDHNIEIGLSIGYKIYDAHTAPSIDMILQETDRLMYQSKTEKKLPSNSTD